MALQPSEFLNYFVDGATWVAASGRTVTLKVQRLGTLYLPSGRLVACDPALLDVQPFAQAFPPGAYPVDVAITSMRARPARWSRLLPSPAEDTRIAMAAVVFQDAMPARWEPAYIDHQPREHTERSYSYAVDSAHGSFMDQRAARMIQDNDLDLFHDLDLVAENPAGQPPWSNLRLRPAEPLNIVMFSSGWGDGTYSSYIGYTSGGMAARVVTDFKVLGGRSSAAG